MAEETSLGVARLRQAITNQATCGSGQFELSIDSADKLCRECEAELARLAWAADVPVPKDADGKVVPLDTAGLYTDEGEMVCVGNIRFNGYSWLVGSKNGCELYCLDELYLVQPDSWALLEKDIFTLAVSKRLADPKGDAKECVSRAKALAERDAVTDCTGVIPVKFCPNCRAKVI